MKKKLIYEPLTKELYNLIGWVGFFNDPKIRLTAPDGDRNELCLENTHAGFMCNFLIDDLKEIRNCNSVLCLWANSSVARTTDYDGQSIFDVEGTKLNTG